MLDPVAGRVWALARRRREPAASAPTYPSGGVLQQPGPVRRRGAAGHRRRPARRSRSAAASPPCIADGFAGRPAAPVRLGACQYGAWSGGGGTVVTACGDARAARRQLGTTDQRPGLPGQPRPDPAQRPHHRRRLEHRLRAADPARRLGRLQAQGDRGRRGGGERGRAAGRPAAARSPSPTPSAPGPAGPRCCTRSTTTPRPVAGCCRSARSSTSPARVGCATISPDGQTVQLDPAAGRARARQLRVLHRRRPGREDRPRHGDRADPAADRERATRGCGSASSREQWTVPAGGVLDVPVLPDWRDRADGDPIVVTVGRRPSAASKAAPTRGRPRAAGSGSPPRRSADRWRSPTPSPTASAATSSGASRSTCRTPRTGRRSPASPSPTSSAGRWASRSRSARSTTTSPGPTR